MRLPNYRHYFAALLLMLALTVPALGQTAFNSSMSKAEPKTPKFVVVTLTTGTAVRVSTTALQFTTATFYGHKAVSATAAPTANTAAFYLGWSDAANSTGVGAGLPAFTDTVAAGASLKFEQSGAKYDLSNVYLVGTTGDKVVIVYTQ